MPFNTLQEKDFFGRQEELAGLCKRVLRADAGAMRGAVLSGPRGIGKTELLKQLFGRLFWKQDRVAPFYTTVNPALLSAADFSKTYLIRFLCQRLAFENKEQALLYHDGLSFDSLVALVEDRGAGWARKILDQYAGSSADPLDGLRFALSAPHRSVLATGVPVAVLMDEFHRLTGLHVAGIPDARLAFLYEEPMSFGKTPYVITGNAAELHEMPVLSRFERIPVRPLGPEDALSLALSLLPARETDGNQLPSLPIHHLGGNPFYLKAVVRAACHQENPGGRDLWNAYIREIMEGELLLSWSSALKSLFPDTGLRRLSLVILHKIYHTKDSLTSRRIAASFSLPDAQAEAIAHALYLGGFIQGEFGLFRATEDRVLAHIIDFLSMREIQGRSLSDLEREFLDKTSSKREDAVRYDITLPMVRESELVAAQCLEQIGRNLQVNQDAIGQMQIAVIEACINATEHSKGSEQKIHLSVAASRDQLEVSIESSGREYIEQETGEPFSDRENAKSQGRGWGIKLMKRYADDVRFEKTSRGTKTVLIKHLEKSADVRKEDTANRE